MALEFIVKRNDLLQALGFVRPTPLRTRELRKHFVDFTAGKSTIEVTSTGASATVLAQVARPGYAHAPIWVLEWFRKTLRTLHQPFVHVAIVDGQMKAENLTYSHPDISVEVHACTIR